MARFFADEVIPLSNVADAQLSRDLIDNLGGSRAYMALITIKGDDARYRFGESPDANNSHQCGEGGTLPPIIGYENLRDLKLRGVSGTSGKAFVSYSS